MIDMWFVQLKNKLANKILCINIDNLNTMSTSIANSDFFKSKVLGHPSGLFMMFFTEMWERFSFYGMRVLLIQYLTAAVLSDNPGLGWEVSSATALYGTYVLFLYLTPILGGIIADKYIGPRNAVITGALIMTLGHASMAIESNFFFFLGLICLIIGTGFFKPSMPAILGEMYKSLPEKKDAAYTIFYMGVNAGAFFGMMLCGYFAEKEGWHVGFGLAGIFMLLGTLQFWLAKPLMGSIGERKVQDSTTAIKEEVETEKRNPFTTMDVILMVIVSIIGITYAINDPLSKSGVYDMYQIFDTPFMRGQNIVILITLGLFLTLLITRIMRYERVIRDRMFGVMLLATFLIFFFMSFEQGATSLQIVARDYIDRSLEGTSLLIFNIVNGLLTVVPLVFISYVLFLLAKATWHQIKMSNIILLICFVLIWAAALGMLFKEFTSETSEITVSWFSSLNAFFIIAIASTVSKLWQTKYNPSAAFKYGFGLVFVSLGFLVLTLGSYSENQETLKISMFFLVLTYFLHTIGELFISPVGLSYVSKLVPGRMLAFMYGVWYLAIAIAQKVAALLGGKVEEIKDEYSLTHFFALFTLIPLVAGLIIMLLNPVVKKLMHGIR